MSSPNWRSTADLQRVLAGLIGNRGFIRCGDLPEVLLRYELEHDAVMLEPGEYDDLRHLCAKEPEMELEAGDILAFLSIIPRVETKSTPSLPHSVSMPDTAMTNTDKSVMIKARPPRRHSDRVRSPSDSSGSDSDPGIRSRKISGSAAFPSHPSMLPSNLPRPTGQRSDRVSSSAAPFETPKEARRKGTQQPPSAYSPFGAFARPSPASRRRRGSTESAPASDSLGDESMQPRPPSQVRVRKISQPSMRASSPLWSGSQPSNPSSPLNPTFGTRYQAALAADNESDALGGQNANQADFSLDMDDERASIASEELDQVGDDVANAIGRHNDSLNPRLSRISTESAASLRTSHDKLQLLQKHNGELARKLRETEKQLAVIGAENERLVEDLQERLEEARSEIAMKRKDEKDMKNKDRAQLIQISGFEADISSLQRSLEAAKANHANMSKMYNSQCDEAQRLRDLLRDRDEEIQRLGDAAQVHEGEEHKNSHEIETLQGEVSRLEQDLQIARQAESHLENQKQENLQLKETIDRMRFELEEARSGNAAQGHSRGATSSGAGTLSRNLGAEISRRLVDETEAAPVVDVRDDQEGSDQEEYVETVVTTHRTRKARTRVPSQSTPGDQVPTSDAFEGEHNREYVDVSVATEPEVVIAGPPMTQGSPPAYTPSPEPKSTELALIKAHPRGVVQGVDHRYDGIVKATGVRCTILESEINHLRSSSVPTFLGLVPEKIIAYMPVSPDFFGRHGFYIVAACAIGIFIGASVINMPNREAALFQRMNTLALASGAGEGFLPYGQRGVIGFMEHGAKMVAGRVPS